MRKQFVRTTLDIMEKDDRVVLLLGDIGVHSFKEAFDRFPNRTYNIGICEQSMISVAAGLALDGLVPIVHTIAPFLIERGFEQLKLDFGYQKLNGNFVSVGGSYEYSKLGCSHHCPGDVALLKTIPGMEVLVPGHPREFDAMLRNHYDNGEPTYYRLSEYSNFEPHNPGFSTKIRGSRGTVLAVGPILDRTVQACEDLKGINVVYCGNVTSSPIAEADVVVTPFYEDSLYEFKGLSIGVPRRFLTNYGTVAEHDEACGLTVPAIRERIKEYFNL